jgi:hypothetical protein
MYVTKNIFDSIIETLLDMPRKSKNGLKSRAYLVQFKLRPEFHPISRSNGKYFLHPTSYTLTSQEKDFDKNLLIYMRKGGKGKII